MPFNFFFFFFFWHSNFGCILLSCLEMTLLAKVDKGQKFQKNLKNFCLVLGYTFLMQISQEFVLTKGLAQWTTNPPNTKINGFPHRIPSHPIPSPQHHLYSYFIITISDFFFFFFFPLSIPFP